MVRNMTNVDMTIRNLDEEVLREFKAEAVRENKTFGQAAVEAFRFWLEHKFSLKMKKKMKLSDSKPVDFGPGTEGLSEQLDEVLYK